MPIELTGLPPSDQHKTTENSQIKVTRTEPTIPQQKTGSAINSDMLTLTGAASKLNMLKINLLIIPVVDLKRVESIKKQVDQGEFEIDTIRTADKCLEFELQLVS